MKPLIGITCNFSHDDEPGIHTHYGLPEQKWHMLADEYIRAIENAGGIPVMLPIYQSESALMEALEHLDGVLISGGNDVDPSLYGEFITKDVGAIVPERDAQDIALTRAVIEQTNKPLLGICRGIQIMNVAMGGTLHQDLGKAGYKDHFVGCCPITHPVHKVKLAAQSLIADIIGSDELAVNSFHHQAVNQIAACFIATAVAEDGTVEALELDGDRMILATQWHPEMMYTCGTNQKIFSRFVAECAKNRL